LGGKKTWGGGPIGGGQRREILSIQVVQFRGKWVKARDDVSHTNKGDCLTANTVEKRLKTFFSKAGGGGGGVSAEVSEKG